MMNRIKRVYVVGSFGQPGVVKTDLPVEQPKADEHLLSGKALGKIIGDIKA